MEQSRLTLQRIKTSRDVMGKKRKPSWNSNAYDDDLVDDNPFVEGLFAFMDSDEGQKYMLLSDTLWRLMDKVQVDAKKRLFIWPDAQRDLDQSITYIHKKYPNFSDESIKDFLTDWLLSGYDPENYSQAQLDELDKLTQRWVDGHSRP
jgi:hypothetical protein